MVGYNSHMEKVHARTAGDTVRNNLGLSQINFLSLTADSLKDMIQAEEDAARVMQQELAMIKEASLCIDWPREKVRFLSYDRDTQKTATITDDLDEVYILARRTFLENQVKSLQDHTRRLSAVLQNAEGARQELLLHKKLRKYNAAGLDLSRILFTKEQNEWISTPYTPNPYHPEDLKYPTNGGLMTRSKSEAKIGSTLEMIGLPYRFDDLVNIFSERTGERPFRNNYFADFKVPNFLGGITVHEHLGAMHLEKYSDNALKRLNDYRNFKVRELPSRIVKPEEFTWSLEADIHDTVQFQRIINRMLLPLPFLTN